MCCRNEPLLLIGLTWLQLNLLLRLPLPLYLLPLLALLLLWQLQFAASGDRTASALSSLGNAGAFFMAGCYEDNIVQSSR